MLCRYLITDPSQPNHSFKCVNKLHFSNSVINQIYIFTLIKSIIVFNHCFIYLLITKFNRGSSERSEERRVGKEC